MSLLAEFVGWLAFLILCLWGLHTFTSGQTQRLLYALVALVFGLWFVFRILLPLIAGAPPMVVD